MKKSSVFDVDRSQTEMPMDVPFVRTPYNYDRNAASDNSGLECRDPSLAQQSAAEECDINTIVRRFGLTGQLPQNVRTPVYGDFEGVFDYQSAMNVVRAADEAFMAMPADVRARFHNSPHEFVDFCSDPGNAAEAAKLGLVDLPTTPPADKAAEPPKVDADAPAKGA